MAVFDSEHCPSLWHNSVTNCVLVSQKAVMHMMAYEKESIKMIIKMFVSQTQTNFTGQDNWKEL